jgi:hypothetical protein
MATYIITRTSPSSNSAIGSSSTTSWAAMRSGSSLTMTEYSVESVYKSEQLMGGAPWIRGGQKLSQFDTSVITSTRTVDRAWLSANSGPQSGNIRVRTNASWAGPNVTTSNWVPGANLSALPLFGTVAAQGRSNAVMQGDPTVINRTGNTRFIAYDVNLESSTEPSGLPVVGWMASVTFDVHNTLYVVTHEPDTILGAMHGSVQLSDGSTAYIEISGGAGVPTATLKHVSVAGTVSTIGTIPTNGGSGSFLKLTSDPQSLALVANTAGDLIVIGARDSSTVRIGKLVWKRLTATTWNFEVTASTQTLDGVLNPHSFAAILVNGSAAGGLGRVFVAYYGVDGERGWVLFDADTQVAWNNLSHAKNPSWLPTLGGAPTDDRSIAMDTSVQFGTSVLVGAGNQLWRVTVSTSGITGATQVSSSFATPRYTRIHGSGTTRWHIVRSEVGWFGQSLTFFEVSGTTLTARTSPGGSPATATFASFYDGNSDSIAFYYWDTNNNTILRRRSFNIATGVWSAELTVSTFTGTGTRSTLRVPVRVSVPTMVDIHHSRLDAGTAVFVRHRGETNVAPTAPTLVPRQSINAAIIERFNWTFNDPNVGDVQSAYQLVIVNNATSAVVHDSGKVLTANTFRDLPAATLANGTVYRWRVRTYDANDVVGPYSADSTFTAVAPATVNITFPTAGGNVSTSIFNVTWTYSQANSVAQSEYRVRILRQSNNSVVVDSGWVAGTATTREVQGVLSGQYIAEVQSRTLGMPSNISTRNFTVSVAVKEETDNTAWAYYEPSSGVGGTGAFVFQKNTNFPTVYSITPNDGDWEVVPSQPNYFDARRAMPIAAGAAFTLTVDAKYIITTGSSTTFPNGLFYITIEYADATTETSPVIQLKNSSGLLVGDGYRRITTSIVAKKSAVAVRVTSNIDLGDWGTVSVGRLMLSAVRFSSTGKIVSAEFVESDGQRGLLVGGSGFVQASNVSLVPASLSDTSRAELTTVGGDLHLNGAQFPGGPRQVLYLTSNTTFVKANYPWLRTAKVMVQAGGGAGGGTVATASGFLAVAAGGGAGGYAESFILPSAMAASVAVTVGAGGAPVSANTGGAGGNSSFGAHVVAQGGLGGPQITSNILGFATSSVGEGGGATAGSVQIPGGAGDWGMSLNGTGPARQVGGHGGDSYLGRGGSGTQSGVGSAGGNYGGGGGGSSSNQSAAARVGGAGAPGIVIIELYG